MTINIYWQYADKNDLKLLSLWNYQLIQDEGHRNSMTTLELQERMEQLLETGYKAIIFNTKLSHVAYALFKENTDDIYLRQFFVTQDQRRKGIGSEAIKALQNDIWPHNKRLTVEVLTANKPAIEFWRSVDYKDYCLTMEILPDKIKHKRIIEVVAHDKRWVDIFQAESRIITKALSGEAISLYHIGSTAVPGLMAKPIIDIQLEIADTNILDKYDAKMQELGYIPKGEFGIPGRRHYQKGGNNRTHHIHAFNIGSDNALRHIAFRDYLIAHPAIAKEYGELKLRCARICNNNIETYCQMKDDFVKKYEQKAIKWKERTLPFSK